MKPPSPDVAGDTPVDRTVTCTDDGGHRRDGGADGDDRGARRYDVKGERGRGGIGRVMEAFDRELDRFVALKELHRVNAASEARFVREAKITARLEHPAIVPVHEVGRWRDGTPYYAMKLVAGRSLKQLIDERDALDERLALIPNVLAVAEAIGYAHSQQVIHRDLKPSNVIVGEHGETIVIDWGLAKDLADSADDDELGAPYRSGGRETLTVVGTVLGTPAYMPPEQARGEPVDARADVYALGAMLYETLSGELPHHGHSSEEILRAVLAGPPRPVGELVAGAPAELVAIIDKAMAREPAARYPTARELAEDLRRFQTGKLVSAHHYTSGQLVRRWIRNHRVPVAIAAIALAVLAVFGTVSIRRILAAERRAVKEREVATEAQKIAEKRAADLVIEQAKGALERDPTEAVAWLKHYPENGDRLEEVRSLAAEAAIEGVAHDVVRMPRRIRGLAFSGTGRLAAVDGGGNAFSWTTEAGLVRLGHTSGQPVWGTFAPNGDTFAVSAGRRLVLFGATARTPVTRLNSHAGELGPAAFAQDGRLVAAGSRDGIVTIWDVAGGRLAQVWNLGAPVYEIAFLDEGRKLAVAPADRQPRIYDVDTGEAKRIRPFAGGALFLEPSPDARAFAIGDKNGVITVHDATTGARTAYRGHEGRVLWAVFSPNGREMASIGADRSVRHWHLADGRSKLLGYHASTPEWVQFSPDGRHIATSAGSELFLWNLATGEQRVLRGLGQRIGFVSFSPDGNWLAAASRARTEVRVWSAHDSMAEVWRGQRQGVHEIDVSADGAVLASAGYDGTLAAWDLHTGRVRQVQIENGGRIMTRVAVAADSSWIAIAGSGPLVHLIDATDLSETTAWSHKAGPVVAIRASPDGEHVATVSTDGTAVVADTTAGTSRTVDFGMPLRSVCFIPGQRAVLIGHIGGASVWHFEDESVELVATVPGEVSAVAASPQGSWLVAGTDAGVIHVLARTDNSHQEWSMHRGHLVGNIAFTHDERQMLTSDDAGLLVRWDTKTWATRSYRRHTDTICAIAVSPDDNWIATASGDTTVRLWHARTMDSLALPHAQKARDVKFLPDGRLASCSLDGTVRIWDAPHAWASREPDANLAAFLSSMTAAEVDFGHRVSNPGPFSSRLNEERTPQ